MGKEKEYVTITIDDQEIQARPGEFIVDVARRHGIYIPVLCNLKGVKPAGSCRICTVLVNGRPMTSCTTPVADGMEITTRSPELEDFRRSVIEILFVEGNHFCPACEKSGNCELQALAYRFEIMVPRYPYQFPHREIDASWPLLLKDHNRCVLCKRCIRTIFDKEGHPIFAFRNRGHELEITIDPEYGKNMTDEMARQAAENCPVGALLYRKKHGFEIPIGKRKYDKEPIGSDVEKRKKEKVS